MYEFWSIFVSGYGWLAIPPHLDYLPALYPVHLVRKHNQPNLDGVVWYAIQYREIVEIEHKST